MVFPVGERRWWRVLFDFGEYGSFTGMLGLMYESLSPTIERSSIVRKVIASLPFSSESMVFDGVELLIKLPPHFRQKIFKRDHVAKKGEIFYRPHIPAISIFADGYEVYEPIEKIGMVRKEDVDKFLDVVEKIKNLASVYVEIRKHEPRKEETEEEEEEEE